MNLNFESMVTAVEFDEVGRDILEITTTSAKDLDYSYERDPSCYPNERVSRLLATPYVYYEGIGVPAAVDPWRLLASSPNFISLAYGVRFVRFDVKMIVRIITAPVNYGFMHVAFDAIDSYHGYQDQENCDPTLVDLGQGDTIERVFPYVGVKEFIKLPLPVNTKVGKITFSKFQSTIQSTSPMPITEIMFLPVNFVMKASAQMSEGSNLRISAAALGAATLLSQLPSTVEYIKGVGRSVKEIHTAGTEIYDEVRPLMEKLKWDDTLVEQKVSDETHNVPSVYGNLSALEYTPCNSVTQGNVDIVKPYHLGDILQSHRILDIAFIPCIKKIFTLPTKDLWVPIVLEPGMGSVTTNNGTHVSYLDAVSKVFRYWRGGFDVNFIFYSSALSTTEFELGFYNVDELATANPGIGANQTPRGYFKRVQVKGTTRTAWRLPFISADQWTPVGFVNSSRQFVRKWVFSIRMLNTTTTGDLSCIPHIVLIVKPSPDFQFKSPCSPITKAAVVQMRVRTSFIEPEDNAGFRAPMRYRPLYEDTLTVEDLCKRWSTRPISTANISNMRNPLGPESYDLFDYLVSMFTYTRGNVRWQSLTGGTTSNYVTYMGSQRYGYSSAARAIASPAGTGISRTDATTNPVAKWESSWDSTVDWGLTPALINIGVFSTDSLAESYGEEIVIDNFSQQSLIALVAAGRGFQVAGLRGPTSLNLGV